MSFLDDIGNWLHKTVDDTSNAMFGAPQAVTRVNQPSGPPLQVRTAAQAPAPIQQMAPQPQSAPIQMAQPLQVMQAKPLQTAQPIQMQMPNQPLQVVGHHQPAPYHPGNPFDDVVNNVVHFGQDLVNPLAKGANTLIGDVGLAGTALSTAAHGGNDQQYYQQAQGINNTFLKPGSGILGQGGYNTAHDLATDTPVQTAIKAAQAGVELAPYGVGGPESKLIEDFGGVIGNKVGGGLAGAIANKGAQYGAQAAIAAPTFAGLNAAEQGITTGHFDPSQAIQAGLQAGGMAAGGAAAADLTRGLVNGVKNTDWTDQRGSLKLPGGEQQPLIDPEKPVPDVYKPLISIAKSSKSADDFDTKIAILSAKGDSNPSVSKAISLIPNSDYSKELYGRLANQTYEYGEPVGDIAARLVQRKQLDAAKSDQIPYDLQPMAEMARNYPSAEAFEKTYNKMIDNATKKGDTSRAEYFQNQKTLAGDLQGFYNKAQQVAEARRIKLEKQKAALPPKPEQLQFSPEAMQYADTFNVTPQQAETDFRTMRNPPTRDTNVPDVPEELTPQQRREIIAHNPKMQDTKNKVNLEVDKGNIKGAIARAMSSIQQRNERLSTAVRLIHKLSDNDKHLFYQWDDGMALEDLVQHADDPKAFKKAVETNADAFDFHLATDRAAGGTTLRQGNYAMPKIYSLSEKEMDAEGIPKTQRFKQGKYTGYRDTSAKYKSYLDAFRQKGLTPFYDNPAEAIKDYLDHGAPNLQKQLLYTTLAKAVPEHVADLATVADSQGRRFTQAAGHLPFNASDELQPYLKNFKQPWKADNKQIQLGIKTAEKTNAAAKAVLFFGAPFHYANGLSRFLGVTVGSGHLPTAVKGTGQALASSLVPTAYRKMEDAAMKDGTYNFIRDNGGELRDVRVQIKPGSSLTNVGNKVNPFGLQQRNMSQFFNAMMITLGRAAKDYGIKSGSPEATALFREYNAALGHINAAVEGHDSTIDRIISGEALAPHWIRTQLGLVKDAAKTSVVPGHIDAKHGIGMFNAGDVARTSVIGTRLTEAAFAILATSIATGTMPTLQSIINRGGFNPNNPIPNIDLGQKNKKGEGQVTVLPTDPIGLVAGAISDPIHFAQSRFSPAISFATRYLSNQDWNGAQLADPNDPNYQTLKLIGAAKGNLPIGMQNFTNPNLTINQGIQQEFGGRIKTDPNDPQAAQTAEYYKEMNAARGALGQNDQNAYDAIHQHTKDANGNYIVQPSVWDTPTKADLYQRNPNVFAADQKANTALAAKGQSVDPFWTQLDSQQQHALLAYQTMPLGGPDKAKWVLQNGSWYTPFEKQRSSWFNSLPPADPNKPQAPIQPPTQSPALSNLLNQYDGITDSQERAQFIGSHPEIGQYFNDMSAYTNKMRVAQGYDPLRTAPVPDQNTSQYMNQYFAANKAGRSALRNADPQNYLAMQNYFANNDRYQLDKQAGLDQLLSPGQDNYTAPSQKYEKAAFNLGQYDIAKGTDANGNTAFQWLPSTNSAAGSTANVSPITQITQGGYGFKGVNGYSGSSSSGGYKKSTKKQKKQKIFIKRKKVRYFKPHTNKSIGIKAPAAKLGKINLKSPKKISLDSYKEML